LHHAIVGSVNLSIHSILLRSYTRVSANGTARIAAKYTPTVNGESGGGHAQERRCRVAARGDSRSCPILQHGSEQSFVTDQIRVFDTH
jgi:hypothetical protein